MRREPAGIKRGPEAVARADRNGGQWQPCRARIDANLQNDQSFRDKVGDALIVRRGNPARKSSIGVLLPPLFRNKPFGGPRGCALRRTFLIVGQRVAPNAAELAGIRLSY
jgi:hypothetical protein